MNRVNQNDQKTSETHPLLAGVPNGEKNIHAKRDVKEVLKNYDVPEPFASSLSKSENPNSQLLLTMLNNMFASVSKVGVTRTLKMASVVFEDVMNFNTDSSRVSYRAGLALLLTIVSEETKIPVREIIEGTQRIPYEGNFKRPEAMALAAYFYNYEFQLSYSAISKILKCTDGLLNKYVNEYIFKPMKMKARVKVNYQHVFDAKDRIEERLKNLQ